MLFSLESCALLCVFAPLIGALGASVSYISPWKTHLSQVITCLFMVMAASVAAWLVYTVCTSQPSQQNIDFLLFSWIQVGTLHVDWGIWIDPLAAVMMGVVTWVSLMVHIYAIGYMHGDPGIPRFMAYLSLFTFFMLMLVTSPNLIQLFFGWEGVGLASYLLIGFWTDKPSACSAAMKAFLVNRIGDIFLALGILATFSVFGTIAFLDIFSALDHTLQITINLPLWGPISAFHLIMTLLFIGSMGKSAQLGLHVWLPDAMEGPTPVSALIHAATMVTAGVFLMARMSPLLEQAVYVRELIMFVGACTAFFAATIACTQTDIKRVIAYSTCSQLGMMFTAIGVSAYSIAIFHLMTHAFFKALLFLGAGSVIHAFSGEQDLRAMGGAWRKVPITYTAMWIGSLALAGVPFLAGYYSKDAIMEAIWATQITGVTGAGIAFILCLSASLLTAFYAWRLLFLTFHGQSRASEKVQAHLHESPSVMTLPLLALILCAVFSGYLTHSLFIDENPILGYTEPTRWHALLHHMHHLPLWVILAPLGVAALGICWAWVFYIFNPQLPAYFTNNLPTPYRFFQKKWYIDELYESLFVKPTWALGRILWNQGDTHLINRYAVGGIVTCAQQLSCKTSALQTGYLHHYALAMLLGIAGFLGWLLWL